MKFCSGCSKEKPLEEFHKNKNSKDGVGSMCKECARAKSRAWNAKNRERKKESGKKWHRENREKANQASAQWRQNNPERSREGKHRCYEENKPHYAAKSLEWVENNKERAREYKSEWHLKNREKTIARSTARRTDSTKDLKTSSWATSYRQRCLFYGYEPKIAEDDERVTLWSLLDRWGDVCFHCGGPFECIDHFPMPVVAGGEHSLANTRPSCNRCNSEEYTHDYPIMEHPNAKRLPSNHNL